MNEENRIQIELTATGMVIARTFSKGGHKTGVKFFTPFFKTEKGIKRKLIQAHKWADDHLKLADKYEVIK